MRKQLLILPFDHRSSFKKLAKSDDPAKITELKTLIFGGFLETISKYENKEMFGILVDEEFGTPILEKANTLGVTTAVSVEKSGQDCFDFEYQEGFGEHIEKFAPTYVKVLVRYNPTNKELNKVQLERLNRLSNYCKENNHKLLFELLVPPTDKDLETTNGSTDTYDTGVRPTKTVDAIKEIKEAVDVTIWKLEWFEKVTWQDVINATNPDSDIIVLGRGDSKEHVKQWLTDASSFDRIIGFAVGRTVFLEPLEKFINNEYSKEEASIQIGNNFDNFVKLWFDLKGIN